MTALNDLTTLVAWKTVGGAVCRRNCPQRVNGWTWLNCEKNHKWLSYITLIKVETCRNSQPTAAAAESSSAGGLAVKDATAAWHLAARLAPTFGIFWVDWADKLWRSRLC